MVMTMTPTVPRAPVVEGQAPRPPAPRRYHGGMAEERTLFTTAEAAAMLGITHDAVKMAVRVGTLPVERINPRLNLVTRAAIEAYRRDYLGRVGRPSRKKARKTRKAAMVAAPEERDQAAHHTIDEGHTQPQPQPQAPREGE